MLEGSGRHVAALWRGEYAVQDVVFTALAPALDCEVSHLMPSNSLRNFHPGMNLHPSIIIIITMIIIKTCLQLV